MGVAAARANDAPLAGSSRIYRIAELIARYAAVPVGNCFKVLDRETGEFLTADYADEPMARAGARLQAACDISQLFDAGR